MLKGLCAGVVEWWLAVFGEQEMGAVIAEMSDDPDSRLQQDLL